jgi:hypothetical protein
MSSPYSAPQTPGAPQTVTIRDRGRMVIPRVCVVCGVQSDEFVEYTQDHAPIILPGIGFVRTTQVTIPYCTSHAARFRERFSRLRWAQGVGYVITAAAGFLAIPRFNRLIGLSVPATIACYVFAVGGFLFLIATIFVVKPYLYDVFYAASGNHLRVRAGLPFLESLIAANPGNVDVVG